MPLTIGVIARDGLPHLRHCLAAVAHSMQLVDDVEVILVDCCSQDQTLQVMLVFAGANKGVQVFTIEGRANAACARNTILKNARPGAVFLVDGDVAINSDFVAAALREINDGTADVVVGQLPEVLHDDDHQLIGHRSDRYGIRNRCSVGVSGGLSLLSADVMAQGFRFDETLRVGEDTDFSIRIADHFRIVALPLPMGTHYTTDYFHGRRARAYLRNLYVRPKGTLLRKHILHPRRLWRARNSVSGILLGGALQATFIGFLIFGEWRGLIAVVAIVCIDMLNAWRRDHLAAYALRRFVSPWLLAYGLIFPDRFPASYSTRALTHRDESVSAPSISPAI